MNAYDAQFSLASEPQAEQPTELTYTPQTADGSIVTELEVVHEQLSHLIIINKDLSYFDHVHVERREDGSFVLSYTFPTGGTYILFADFVPKATSQQVIARHVVSVRGATPPTKPLQATLPDVEAGGLRGHLQAEQEPLAAGTPATLILSLTDTAGQPTGDLEPYLGASGHMVIISEDAQTFVHAHPIARETAHGSVHEGHEEIGQQEAGYAAHEASGPFGPELAFHTEFPHPGRYKVWVQVKRAGKVVTLPFVVEVAG